MGLFSKRKCPIHNEEYKTVYGFMSQLELKCETCHEEFYEKEKEKKKSHDKIKNLENRILELEKSIGKNN